MSSNQATGEVLMRLPAVLARFPVSRSTFWAGVRSGRYPKPVKEGGSTFWRQSDVDALIARTTGAAA